jgi:hypothetical protein
MHWVEHLMNNQRSVFCGPIAASLLATTTAGCIAGCEVHTFAYGPGSRAPASTSNTSSATAVVPPPPAAAPQPVEPVPVTVATVVSRYGLTLDDAYRLPKVREVFAKLDPAVVVHATELYGRWSPGGTVEGSPTELNFPSPEVTDCPKGALSAHGMTVWWRSVARPQHSFHGCEGTWRPRAAAQTPGVLWAVGDGKDWNREVALFVAFDGGAYVTALRVLAPGAGSPDAWPAPIQASAMSEESIKRLGQMGAIPDKVAKDVDAGSSAWFACVERAWVPSGPEFDANDLANVTDSTREIRANAIGARYERLARAKCASLAASYEAKLVRIFDERDKVRMELFNLAKSQLTR